MDKGQEIRFETKEEANERRTKETMARSPHERFMFFIQLCEEMQFFYSGTPHPNRIKNNFIIE